MSILIKSAKLGRRVWVAETKEDAREIWKSHPQDRGAIYLASEVEAMKGIDVESLKAVQLVKDAFPGAVVEDYEAELRE